MGGTQMKGLFNDFDCSWLIIILLVILLLNDDGCGCSEGFLDGLFDDCGGIIIIILIVLLFFDI